MKKTPEAAAGKDDVEVVQVKAIEFSPGFRGQRVNHLDDGEHTCQWPWSARVW